jgi:tellurite methyltransferase
MSQPGPKLQAADYAAKEDWPGFFDVVSGKPPRDTLLWALKKFDEEGATRLPRRAIDLGAGEGRDTAELLRRGWRVEAIDSHPESMPRIWGRPDLMNADRLVTTRATYESCILTPCELLNASYALPFCPPTRFDEVWARIRAAIVPGGRFAGQLFGDRDTWASIPTRSHQTEARVRELLAGLEVEHFEIEENDKATSMGEAKHWHIFHIVARNPASRPASRPAHDPAGNPARKTAGETPRNHA